MCGIVGLLNTDGAPASPAILQRMTAALAHRGPDGEGLEIGGPAGLGHRRLAIIDLEGGKQPLANEDGRVWITYNGELYNYRELRPVLEAHGHRFRTNSDTEVILHAYEEWGDACVERFRGMFAFAIHDGRKRRLFLARDHLGIKPLYWLQAANCFAFASELQALRHVPGVPFEIDLPAVAQYLRLQYIAAPRTIFRNVWKLPPACRMSVAFDGRISGPEEYWRLEFRPNRRRAKAEWLEALDEVLRDSVRAHLVADVPFGAFLSGGVDSSAVVAYMAEILDRPVRTFTIGFEEEEYSELSYAEQAARQCGTEHHVEIVRPDALAILPDLVRCYGEPFGDSSAVPTYYVSKMARAWVPMILSGDGGDETFAGYGTHREWMNLLAGRAPRPLWKRLARPVAERLLPSRYPPVRPSLDYWLPLVTYLHPAEQADLWRPEYRNDWAARTEAFDEAFAQARRFDPCSIVQYLDIKTYLPFDILTKVDVASMMHGLEVRTPLVDVRVMEFAATIPSELCMARGNDGQWRGKRLLRDLLRRRFPADFLDRPKMGFGVPIARWFRSGGAYHRALEERLLGPASTRREWFEPAAICRLIDENRAGPLWLLLFLEEWLRQNAGCPVARPEAVAAA
jgi:asparagine synthase (glutamine-hydrolysing)